jgi:hypothetical protein
MQQSQLYKSRHGSGSLGKKRTDRRAFVLSGAAPEAEADHTAAAIGGSMLMIGGSMLLIIGGSVLLIGDGSVLLIGDGSVLLIGGGSVLLIGGGSVLLIGGSVLLLSPGSWDMRRRSLVGRG